MSKMMHDQHSASVPASRDRRNFLIAGAGLALVATPGTTQYPHLIENSGAPQVRLTDSELRESMRRWPKSHCRAAAPIRLPKVSLIKVKR